MSTGGPLRRNVPYIFFIPLVVVFKFIVQFFQCVDWLVNLVLTWQRLFYILYILSHLWSAICHQHQNDRAVMRLLIVVLGYVMIVHREQMENKCSVDSSPPPNFLALAIWKGGESLVHNFTHRISWNRHHPWIVASQSEALNGRNGTSNSVSCTRVQIIS